MTEYSSDAPDRRRSGGPNPGALAIVVLALMFAGILLAAVLSGGALPGSPFQDSAALVARYADNSTATRVLALFQFGAAVPLGILAATLYARQLRLGIRVPGPGIGFFGGIAASILLMLSGLCTWLLSRPEIVTDAPLTHAFAFLAFLTGGVGFVVGLGLLIAGVAVPALILHLVPGWLAWTGLVIAALAELSFLSLVFEPLQLLLPIGRFGGGLWLIVVCFLLPVTRAAANRGRS